MNAWKAVAIISTTAFALSLAIHVAQAEDASASARLRHALADLQGAHLALAKKTVRTTSDQKALQRTSFAIQAVKAALVATRPPKPTDAVPESEQAE